MKKDSAKAKPKAKKAGKVKDLPAKTMNAKDAAKIKGGTWDWGNLKVDGANQLKINTALPTTLTNIETLENKR